jgi:hypothetical protein
MRLTHNSLSTRRVVLSVSSSSIVCSRCAPLRFGCALNAGETPALPAFALRSTSFRCTLTAGEMSTPAGLPAMPRTACAAGIAPTDACQKFKYFR